MASKLASCKKAIYSILNISMESKEANCDKSQETQIIVSLSKDCKNINYSNGVLTYVFTNNDKDKGKELWF